jgi:hypothetical protein
MRQLLHVRRHLAGVACAASTGAVTVPTCRKAGLGGAFAIVHAPHERGCHGNIPLQPAVPARSGEGAGGLRGQVWHGSQTRPGVTFLLSEVLNKPVAYERLVRVVARLLVFRSTPGMAGARRKPGQTTNIVEEPAPCPGCRRFRAAS